MQTGVGPFVAVYLASLHWTQSAVGFALTIAGLTGVFSQLVAGAAVDASRHKRALLAASILATAVSAIVLAVAPTHPLVIASQVLHGFVGSVNGPAIVAVSLGLVGYRRLAVRLGRNHSYDSAGNIASAGLMGLVGYLLSTRAIFWVTALLAIPALLALSRIRPSEIDDDLARGSSTEARHGSIRAMLSERRFLTFMACAVLFHFANAAMLPMLGAMLAHGKERQSSLLLSACLMTTQAVVALASPWIGRHAESIGRKPLLVIGFAVLPVRGVLYTLTTSAPLLVGIQVLDGVGVGVFNTVSALVIADVTRGSGRFNFAQGTIGVAVGIGASSSNALAGVVVDRFGWNAGFLSLSMVALAALVALVAAMPETMRREPMSIAGTPDCRT